MSLYTSLYFAPRDREWIAPASLITEVAALVGASSFDFVTVRRRRVGGNQSDDGAPFEEILTAQNVLTADALKIVRADLNHWTHLMFPLHDFMRGLSRAVFDSMPPEVSGNYCPWDTSLYYGQWSIDSYEEGTEIDRGRLAFVISANGCPPDFGRYLDCFLGVDRVIELRGHLEGLSGIPWSIIMNLT